MLPQELDGVTVLVDVPETGVRAGEEGMIVAIRRDPEGRLLYTVEIAGGEQADLDSTQFGLD
ncbi:MAG: hypothetical protein JWR84_3451 [Caulobacter sp.]|nr:hypothetical protein [Caulobacter sp.]